jgi:hypothetical protein
MRRAYGILTNDWQPRWADPRLQAGHKFFAAFGNVVNPTTNLFPWGFPKIWLWINTYT